LLSLWYRYFFVKLHNVLFVLSLRKSKDSSNSSKLLQIYALIYNSHLQLAQNIDRSVMINTYQSTNNVVVDLILSDSASLTNDADYNFQHAILGHPFKANMNQKLC
jgi:hypothetical protein